MGVVELDGDFVGEGAPIRVVFAEAADDVAQGAGDEEILLHEAKFFAVLGFVVRVKNFRDGLAVIFIVNSFLVAAAVEGVEVEAFRGTGFPEAEEIDGVGAVAGDGDVVGDAEDCFGADPCRAAVTAIIKNIFYPSVDVDGLGVFGADDFPWVTEFHPVVGKFDLVAVAELLFEEAEFVVDTVADGREVKRGQGVEEAGSQATEAAVAQTHVIFFVADFLDVEAEFAEHHLGVFKSAGVVEAVGKQASHQKLEGEVVNPADIFLVVHALGGDQAFDDALLSCFASRDPPIAFCRCVGVAREAELEGIVDGFFDERHRVF